VTVLVRRLSETLLTLALLRLDALRFFDEDGELFLNQKGSCSAEQAWNCD
jgi:hypothetical protein